MESIFTTPASTTRTIKPGDKNFKIHNGLTLSDRASIEITTNCPGHYAQLIIECYNRGWIKPVATMTEREYMLMGLSNEQ